MSCPQGQKSWHGKCLTPAEVEQIGPCLCRPDERWWQEAQGCVCKYRPFTKRSGDQCVLNPTALAVAGVGVIAVAYYFMGVR